MNPGDWPPGYGPSSAPPPASAPAVNEWGVPLYGNAPAQGGFPPQGDAFNHTGTHTFATSPTSQPSFQPASFGPSEPIASPPTSSSNYGSSYNNFDAPAASVRINVTRNEGASIF